MPTVSQVKATLPHAFKEKYLNTYVIIDASEFFLETPSDLRLQSSTWSDYKHHNTAKLLIACTVPFPTSHHFMLVRYLM